VKANLCGSRHARRTPFLVFCLAFGLLVPLRVEAFTMGPLEMLKTSGHLDVRNDSQDSIRVLLQVYKVSRLNGQVNPAAQPMSLEESQAVVHYRPRSLRMAGSSSRAINYRIVDPLQPFFICGETPSGMLTLRVCSYWRGPTAKPPTG
jgi:hypothetical protein